MIYTVTLNPSIDYNVTLDELQLGELNRIHDANMFPGGKGINVSKVLKNLGVNSTALGFIGGFTGTFVESNLKENGIHTNFVQVKEPTRINVKLKTAVETEMNASGPQITEENFAQLKKSMTTLEKGDMLVLSGSIPTSLEQTTYEQLIEIAKKNDVEVVVDAEGDLLKNTLRFEPFFIKPNHHELGGLFQVEIHTAREAIPYAKRLVEMGAKNVVVSLAGEGALFVNEKTVLLAKTPKGKLISSVGAGDSLVAGFLAKYIETNNDKEAFRYAVATGSATAYSVGLAERETIETLLNDTIIYEEVNIG